MPTHAKRLIKNTTQELSSLLKGFRSMDNKQKKKLTEADIISKFIMPAIESAGWDSLTQIRQEVKLRDGKVIVRGNLGMSNKIRGQACINVYY